MGEDSFASAVALNSHTSHSSLSHKWQELSRSVYSPKSINTKGTWGRHSTGRPWARSLIAATPVFLAPFASLLFYITLFRFNGSLAEFYGAAQEQGLWSVLTENCPRFSLGTTLAYSSWVVFQAVLSLVLPGARKPGQLTPAGHKLWYRMNGLNAWVVTHLTLALLCWKGGLDPGFIPRNWGHLVFAMNLSGFVMSTLALFKAYVVPSHSEDRKFSGCTAYDFYMGIELNPRIGQHFDLKLFTNGRIGMMSWTIIDLSNVAYQYQEYGTVGASLILVTFLHMLYTLDFFYKEDWYLKTVDIAHDHYGFYLAWGCFAFLPTTYTLQAQYLGLYPTSPSWMYLATMFAIGIAGYVLFRSVNDQKDRARHTRGNCLIWGKPAKYIKAKYTTSDGQQHESLLLTSGFWGWSRHANYVGDLFLSFSMCSLVGTTKILVWFYGFYMTLLLVHRCLRDEARGSMKYGATWDKYCEMVPWRLVPGIW